MCAPVLSVNGEMLLDRIGFSQKRMSPTVLTPSSPEGHRLSHSMIKRLSGEVVDARS